VWADSPVGRASLGVNFGGHAPTIPPAPAIENHLDVVFARESGSDVLVEARMITRNDQQVADRSPAG
jgi:hypothetical protein